MRTEANELHRIMSASVRDMLDAYRIQARLVTDKALEEILFRAAYGVLQSLAPYPGAIELERVRPVDLGDAAHSPTADQHGTRRPWVRVRNLNGSRPASACRARTTHAFPVTSALCPASCPWSEIRLS